MVPDGLHRLQQLLAYPREDLDIEFKCWLDMDNPEHRADIAQAILALANHGGGYIIIGLDETSSELQTPLVRPDSLRCYDQDAINGIVHKFADPPFHCQVHFVAHPDTAADHPVIIVPGGHKVPIRSKAQGSNNRHVQMNCYYIRRPGPKSETIQTAQEWDHLIGRCLRAQRDDLLENIRALLYGAAQTRSSTDTEDAIQLEKWNEAAVERFNELKATLGPNENPGRYEHGVWTLSYRLAGDVKKLSLAKFREAIQQADAHLTGWPTWSVFHQEGLAPKPYRGIVECWLKNTTGQNQYYSAEPGKFFDPFIPVWRIGECLLHAERMATLICEAKPDVIVQATWSGLLGRKLHRRFGSVNTFLYREAREDIVRSTSRFSMETITNGLPEAISEMLQPLYDVFDFYEMPIESIQEQVTKLKNRDWSM